MPNFGPFETAADAVFAACPLILSMPHAVAGRRDDQNFRLYFQLSTEYCGLVYYTPERKFEMSMLTASYSQTTPGARHCPYVSRVSDSRYPSDSLKYVYMIHNHAFDGELSKEDVSAIVALGREHGFEAMAQDEKIRIAVVAFFSNASYDQPSCDGFFDYIPVTGMISKWTIRDGGWRMRPYQKVVWTSPSSFTFEKYQ